MIVQTLHNLTLERNEINSKSHSLAKESSLFFISNPDLFYHSIN